MTSSTSENDVLVVGASTTPVGEHWDKSLRELALEAIQLARAESPNLKPQSLYVANMLAANLSRQAHLGALLADFAALRGIEAVTVEAAGASGGMALRQAYLALKSGLMDVALVVGVEKITESVSAEVNSAVTAESDADFESIHGISSTSQAALLMKRYLHEHDVPPTGLAGFGVTAHANAATNPSAMYRRPLDLETYTKAPILSDPINVYDAAPLADGSAALLLARRDRIKNDLPYPSVRIAASSAAISAVAIHDRKDPLTLSAAASSVEKALRLADLSQEDIDAYELHDRYSIYAALALEAAGFAERGKGWELAENGSIDRDGSIPICTMGGSKARGDTGGATGVYQIAELVFQLQGRAGDSQIPEVRVGMAQCLGGTGATAATHILTSIDMQ